MTNPDTDDNLRDAIIDALGKAYVHGAKTHNRHTPDTERRTIEADALEATRKVWALIYTPTKDTQP